MADHPNAALARQAFESMDGGDPSGMAGFLADDIVWHEIGGTEPVRGKAALMERMTGGSRDFEITTSLHDVVANDEHIVALVNAHATRGGKTLDYRTTEIMHVKDGKVTERWAFSDDTAAINEFFG